MVRAGIVGLGRMGARWVTAAKGAGVDVVVGLDTAVEPYAVSQDPSLSARHTRVAEEFWSHAVDVIVIATTAPTHFELLETGISRGIKRLVVEKPFTTSCAEADEAVSLAESAGARVVVNHGREYWSNYQRIGEVANQFGLGQLRSIHVTLGAAGFGCVGIHYLRLFLQLFGEMPDTVFAETTTPRAPNPRGQRFDDPGGIALLSFPGERRAVLDMGDDVGVPPWSLLVFERGRISIPDEAQHWFVEARAPEFRDEPLSRYGTPLQQHDFPGFEPFGIVEMAQCALADVLGNDPVICGVSAGRSAMEVFAAVRWSAAHGRVVRLPLEASAREVRYSIP